MIKVFLGAILTIVAVVVAGLLVEKQKPCPVVEVFVDVESPDEVRVTEVCIETRCQPFERVSNNSYSARIAPLRDSHPRVMWRRGNSQQVNDVDVYWSRTTSGALRLELGSSGLKISKNEVSTGGGTLDGFCSP